MEVIVTGMNLATAKAAAQPSALEASQRAYAPGPAAEVADLKIDTLVSRMLKLVPGEVAAGYTALLAFASSAIKDGNDGSAKFAAPVAIVLCCILIFMLIRQAGATHKPPVKPHPTQYIVSILAFVAWAFSMRNPLAGFDREVPGWILGFSLILIPIFGGLILRDHPPKPRADA